MDRKVFSGFRQIAYQHAGIAIRDNKESLVSARIAKRIRTLGLTNDQEYLDYLQNDSTGDELVSFLDAISTNFTSFFREQDHFELLKRDLLERVEGRVRRVRVWCAASSTGEEPYTLAMTLAESLDGKLDDWRLMATDISTRALEIASAGRYELERIAQVPKPLRSKYFQPELGATGKPEAVRVKPVLRERVVFKRLNLSTPPFPFRGELDVVFCRNVMIYFDLAVRQRLITEIERLLKPGGLLVIAHSETLAGIASGLQMLKPSVYRKAA